MNIVNLYFSLFTSAVLFQDERSIKYTSSMQSLAEMNYAAVKQIII